MNRRGFPLTLVGAYFELGSLEVLALVGDGFELAPRNTLHPKLRTSPRALDAQGSYGYAISEQVLRRQVRRVDIEEGEIVMIWIAAGEGLSRRAKVGRCERHACQLNGVQRVAGALRSGAFVNTAEQVGNVGAGGGDGDTLYDAGKEDGSSRKRDERKSGVESRHVTRSAREGAS